MRYRPFDTEIRVIESDTMIVSGGVVICDLVENFGIGLQGTEAMSKTNWHQQLMPVGSRELDGNVTAKCRRGATKIDRHIKDASPRNSHELTLAEWRALKMKPPDRAGFYR